VATYTRVQATPAGTTGGGTLNLSFGTLPTHVNAIFVKVSFTGGIGTTAVTDNQGNTYTKAVGANRVGFLSEVWFTYNIGVPSGTFTVTATGASTIHGQAEEWSGFGTLNPLFTTGSTAPLGSYTLNGTLPTVNPDAVGIFAGMTANIQTASISAPWTTDYNFNSFSGFGGHYLISSAGTQSISIVCGGGSSGALAIFQDPADFSAERVTQVTESIVFENTTPVHATQVLEGRVFRNTSEVRATQVVLTLIMRPNVVPAGPVTILTPFKRWGLERFDIKVRSEERS